MIWLDRRVMTPVGPIQYKMPYFEELVAIAGGPADRVLPKDLGAHALWYYFCLASKAHDTAKKCLVLENERSPTFTPQQARQLATTVANLSGLTLQEMVRFWPECERQRRALGLSENAELPAVFKMRFV